MKSVFLVLALITGYIGNIFGLPASKAQGFINANIPDILKESRTFGFKKVPTPKPPAPVSTPTPTITPTPTPKPPMSLPPINPGEQGVKVPILLYHYISDNPNKDDKTRTGLSTPPYVFDKQLELLAAGGFTTITLDELAAALDGQGVLPPKPVMLTFDDGYADFYFNAYPILQKYHMKGISFIPTGLIGGGAYMTWGQIEEIARSGAAVFGAHSIHHYALTHVSYETLKNEVEESKLILEQHVGYRVNWFSYPYGVFNDTVVNEVRRAGYIGSTTTLPGVWQYKSRFFYIPRYRAGMRLGNDLLKLVQ